MRVQRPWLPLALLVPAAGVAFLLRSSGPRDEEPRAKSVSSARERASSGARREPSAWETPAAQGRADAGASADPERAKSSPSSARAATPLAAELKPLLKRLHEARDRDDEKAAKRERDEIAALIARDRHGAVVALIAALKTSDEDGEAGVVLDLLTSERGLPHGEVLAALSDMAAHDDIVFHRQAAIHGLGELAGGDADRVAQVAALGRSDREGEVRETAAVTLGELGDRSPGPVAQAAAHELVQSLASERDPRVRSCLVYAFRDTRDDATAGALFSALRDDDAGVRLAAADVLGDVAAAHRDQAVKDLAARFAQETDPQLRRTIVTAIVRAGRIGAISTLEKLQGGDLQPFIDDFLAGLRSGEDNMEKLYAIRFSREQARKN